MLSKVSAGWLDANKGQRNYRVTQLRKQADFIYIYGNIAF